MEPCKFASDCIRLHKEPQTMPARNLTEPSLLGTSSCGLNGTFKKVFRFSERILGDSAMLAALREICGFAGFRFMHSDTDFDDYRLSSPDNISPPGDRPHEVTVKSTISELMNSSIRYFIDVDYLRSNPQAARRPLKGEPVRCPSSVKMLQARGNKLL